MSKLFDQSEKGQLQKKSQSSEEPSFKDLENEETSAIDSSSSVEMERPKLPKAYSDSKQPVVSLESQPQTPFHIPQKELTRRRSKTLGSVENDAYSKWNGSLAKTIGSLVMLKQRQNTNDSIHSLENNSDENFLPSKIPEVLDFETEETYLQRLLDEGFETEIPSILSDKNNDFLKRCLERYIAEKFNFRDEPLDISLRKFLMNCELPKETQQIDRVLSTFSSRYYECNSEIWDNSDQIYLVTFSLVMLHTDHFNTNNKKKMTKDEFVKNTKVDDVDEKLYSPFIVKEILEYFYDNITFARFIQKTKSPLLQQQSVYSLPKRIFSSSSSTNLVNMNHTNGIYPTTTINGRSHSLSSSTSQFFSSNQIDPYCYIIDNQIDSLKLNLGEVKDETTLDKLKFEISESYYQTIKENLVGLSGVYLRFHKDLDWLPAKTELKFNSTDHQDSTKSFLNVLKVIRVAELYREETVRNGKFFTMGSTSRVIWKKCFGVLTTCGLFIFDNLNFLSISDREKLLEEKNLKESIKIDISFDHILRSCSKLSINGLFACEADENTDNNCCFRVYSTNKKELFSTNTLSEKSFWILAINFISSLDGCYLDSVEYENREVSSLRSISIDNKILKLSKNLPDLNHKILELTRIQKHISNLAPFQTKTKEALNEYYRTLEIKLDWLWYELGRNEVYVELLKKELQNNDYRDKVSLKTDNDRESLLEDSFINDDYKNNNDADADDRLRLIKRATQSNGRHVLSSSPVLSLIDNESKDHHDQYFDALNDNF
jgi:hypothetical protein